jgi:hypothetical protein
LEASSLDVNFFFGLQYLEVEASNACSNDRINDDEQAIIANMVQGWIREVNQMLGRTSYGEKLGKSYT